MLETTSRLELHVPHISALYLLDTTTTISKMLSTLAAILLAGFSCYCGTSTLVAASPTNAHPSSDDSVNSQHLQKPLYTPPWQTMPSLPPLPPANFNGTIPINGIDLWYATFGAPLSSTQAKNQPPLLFLHGGFANSEYWAHQILHLQDSGHTLITIDSRAQGRSSDDTTKPITYDAMTLDVVGLMDHLEVEKVEVVGWSDGAIVGFDLAMNLVRGRRGFLRLGGVISRGILM